MKVFRADLRASLPHDWTGSVADALRYVADFLDDAATGIDVLPPASSFGNSNSCFLHNLERGIKVTGGFSVFECEPGVWRWVRVDDSSRIPRMHWMNETGLK